MAFLIVTVAPPILSALFGGQVMCGGGEVIIIGNCGPINCSDPTPACCSCPPPTESYSCAADVSACPICMGG
ncbi:Uncharacterised protein [uncultured archaeon]|nr:Uncharacterised protein [uncultured archaeon]